MGTPLDGAKVRPRRSGRGADVPADASDSRDSIRASTTFISYMANALPNAPSRSTAKGEVVVRIDLAAEESLGLEALGLRPEIGSPMHQVESNCGGSF